MINRFSRYFGWTIQSAPSADLCAGIATELLTPRQIGVALIWKTLTKPNCWCSFLFGGAHFALMCLASPSPVAVFWNHSGSGYGLGWDHCLSTAPSRSNYIQRTSVRALENIWNGRAGRLRSPHTTAIIKWKVRRHFDQSLAAPY